MTADPLAELVEVSSRKELAEVGGSHNQKGVDFQRCWAVMRMFELEDSGVKDFLLLFEAIQDVAILDSATSPTSICVYQVKKKDRKEWAWADLTALHAPPKPSGKRPSKPRDPKPLSAIHDSPLGKLYATVRVFKTMDSTGAFISNAGCDLPLAAGGTAATSLMIALSELSTMHLDLLMQGLETLHGAGEPAPDLSRIHLQRVVLPVDAPVTHLVGVVHGFLEQRSPRHAGQARSLVESLLARIGPLGARTNPFQNFAEMTQHRGFSRKEFTGALGTLETLPDQSAQLETWLTQLQHEGMGFMDIAGIRSAAAGIIRRQVMGTRSSEQEMIEADCRAWLASATDPAELRPFFAAGAAELQPKYPSMRKSELLAHLALQAISKCAAPI